MDFYTQVKAFLAGGKKREVVLFTPGLHARKQCQMDGLAPDPILLRLIRVQLKSGETAVLATSLLDEEAYPSTWFKHFYHLR